MADTEHDPAGAVPGKKPQLMENERLTGYLNERLRRVPRVIAKPRG
jgi:hypothetical protein